MTTTEVIETQNNTPQVADKSPMSMMATAMAQGADIAQLERMMDLQFKWEANEAKKAYIKAMAAFKADPPKIFKDTVVDYTSQKGRTHFKHASLGNITEKISAGLGKQGLSAGWKTEQDQNGIKITCTITHDMGHSESTSLYSPADSSGGKNSIQAIGSTISYLERYTLLALTGLATHDMDDDGIKSGPAVPMLNESQISMVVDMMAAAKITDRTDYLNYIGVGTVEQIPANRFNAIMAELKQIADRKK